MEVDCPTCHGAGDMGCQQGCHTQDCDTCDGTGYIEVEADT